MLAATKVKLSDTKKKQSARTRGSFWNFYVVVVQNSDKKMYKKSMLHVQSCFFAN